MATEKILNTRVQLKYDSYENWIATANQFKLRPGEVAVVNINGANGANLNNGTENTVVQPTILFKVGIGNPTDESTWKTFNQLPWASALAADVHTWAKKTENEFKAWVAENATVLDGTDSYSIQELLNLHTQRLGDVSALTTADKTAVGAINEHDTEIGDLTSLNTQNKSNLVSAINEALQAVEAGGTGSVVTVAKEVTPTEGSEVTYTVKQGGNAVDVKIEVPKYATSADYGVLGVTGKDAIKVTEGQNPEVSLALDDSGNVELTQSATGLKAAIDLSAYRLIAEDEDTQYHVEYDSTAKKIKLVPGADASKMEIDATDFIKDGMIDSVELVQTDADGNKGQFLKLTWNDDGNDVTYVPVGQLVDVYTAAVNATEVQVAISNTYEVSATLVNGGVTTAKIANDAVTADKLADTINEAIAKGVEAQGWGDHKLGGYAKDADLTNVINGTTPVAKATDADQLGGQLPGYYATATSVTDITKDDGTIDTKVKAAIEALDSSVAATAEADNQVSVLTGVTQTDGKLTDKTEVKLAAIAKTGNVNDLIQTEGDVLIFNCGSATEVI